MRRTWVIPFAALAICGGAVGRPSAAEIKDAESATHGDAAASYQVVDTYAFPGFKVIQFELAVLSHYSYLLVSGQDGLVVDPGRDVFAYVEAAKKEGAAIRAVWLSHSHADFIAGHMELASQGVPVYISTKAGAGYEHEALQDGATLTVGDAILTFRDTPGHTPDGMCAVVSSRQAPDRPLVMFTGDTLFIGSVGRPDLLGKGMAASTLAAMMFDTWTSKLSRLPDEVQILPAHGAGSLCGAHLSDEPTSTLGQQRVANPYLQHKNRSEFIAAVLEGLPEAPQYFSHNAAENRKGPELAVWRPDPLPILQPSQELTDPARANVVDLRSAAEYSAGHVPNSVNIGLRGRFETWTGIMVPWDANLVVCGSEADLREAIYRLNRVGYKARGLLFDAWQQAKLPLGKNSMIAPRELYDLMQTPRSPLVIDVRLPSEWMALRIGTVINIPLTHLAEKVAEIDPAEPVVAVCNSAYRSSMAVGILERAGFQDAGSLAGGSEAWIAAGLPVLEATAPGAAGSAPKRQVRLAERISAAELKRLMMDLPGTFQLVDVRPGEQFADYRLPGSENVDIAELIGNPAYLTGAGPLILVCRDGSLAMMAGGILSQKTERPVKALYGGLEAYWAEYGLGGAAARAAASVGAAPGAGAPAGSPPAPAPSTGPKRKKAGC